MNINFFFVVDFLKKGAYGYECVLVFVCVRDGMFGETKPKDESFNQKKKSVSIAVTGDTQEFFETAVAFSQRNTKMS